MIIDCHGHYTTEPKALHAYRQAQIAGLKDPSWRPTKAALAGPRDLSSAHHQQIRGLEQLNGATPDFLPFLVRVRRSFRDAMLVGDLRD